MIQPLNLVQPLAFDLIGPRWLWHHLFPDDFYVKLVCLFQDNIYVNLVFKKLKSMIFNLLFKKQFSWIERQIENDKQIQKRSTGSTFRFDFFTCSYEEGDENGK